MNYELSLLMCTVAENERPVNMFFFGLKLGTISFTSFYF